MLRSAWTILLVILLVTLVMAQEDSTPPPRVAVVADFTSSDDDVAGAAYSDALRMKLHRLDDWDTIDAITTRDTQPTPLGADAEQTTLNAMASPSDADLAIAGTLTTEGDILTLDLVIADVAAGTSSRVTFSDDTQRAKAIITRAAVEHIIGRELWPPPVNDEPEPELTDPINDDPGFENDATSWTGLDNVTAMISPSEDTERGNVLVVQTDVDREAWIAYHDDLATGVASVDNPPDLAVDTGYASLGGLDGVHVRSAWIPATPGARYWLTADVLAPAGSNARVFVKGFTNIDAPIGMTETALREHDMTPNDLSAMDPDAREELLQAELDEHPERYRTECYRWYLTCTSTSGQWEHFAAPFPPRDGLPDNVAWFRIDIFAAWPAGEYRFDDVSLYLAPAEALAD
jgi:hypothetical protein